MKKHVLLLLLLVTVVLNLVACQNGSVYTPTGEFYSKTSPASGDVGVTDVISLEADKKSYEGSDDIIVPMTVGFGHLPGTDGYKGDHDTFYVEYQVIEAPWQADKLPAWGKKVEYKDSWYDTKYDSTAQKNSSFLFIPFYGKFYPLHKEPVEIVFPANVEKGYLEVRIYVETDDQGACQIAVMSVAFERANGVLTLKNN